ncbi:MAG: creatininase family protein [Candidatus Poribacteria bacterium]|nr:creatininase family protein [Candidatus Poribacteria bacterium]
MSVGEIRLERMTRKEAWAKIQSGDVKVAIVPTGSLEQHLTHMAMVHDIQSATMVAEEVARRVYPSAIVTVPLNAGISEHHMEFRFGSITLKPGTFQAVVWDTVDSLVRHGVDNVLILNGHGGNVAPMNGAINQYRRYFGKNIHFASYWDFLPKELGDKVLDTKAVPGHAQEFETSLGLLMFPENVRLDEQKNSDDEGVRVSTKEKGVPLYDAIIDALVEHVKGMADGSNQAELTGL